MSAGVPPSGSGYSAEPEPSCTVSAVPVSIPNAALACYDCGLPYAGDHWVEAVVPHDVWNKHLSPSGDEGGILCINCMAKRAASEALFDVPVKLTAGPFVAVGTDPDYVAAAREMYAALRLYDNMANGRPGISLKQCREATRQALAKAQAARSERTGA